MVNATRPPSIVRSLMNPRLTISRCRSGSRTTFSADRTDACSTCMSSRISYTCPHMSDGAASPNRGVMIVLAYVWPLALVPLHVEKNDAEVQWHAKHGLVLMIAELILLFGYIMMTSIVSLATLGLGCVLSLFLVFGWVAVLALHVVAILKGVNGGRLIIPGLSDYANRL